MIIDNLIDSGLHMVAMSEADGLSMVVVSPRHDPRDGLYFLYS